MVGTIVLYQLVFIFKFFFGGGGQFIIYVGETLTINSSTSKALLYGGPLLYSCRFSRAKVSFRGCSVMNPRLAAS
jgi:hypothetical protein